VLSHALITAWNDHGQQQLVAVELGQPGVQVTNEGWHAVGMAATGSVQVIFHNVAVSAVGEPGAYLARPGFWQGGIGIAACWFGAASSIAQRLLQACAKREEAHALAHLGALDMTLSAAAGMLREAARLIDQQPQADAELLARRCRALVEHACERAIEHAGRAMGAGPYCQDAQFARLIADLPVFLRQSHAERDLAQLGKLLAQPEIPSDHPQPSAGAWSL
jgi:alkylation response protein AidB-like acyl-CoA dehydrogenase